MKNIILTTTITAVLATSANAATIIENDKFKYTLKGDWQVQLRQKVGNDEDLKMEFDDFELKNKVTYKLGNGMKAIGALDFDVREAGDTDLFEEGYLGLGFGKTTVTFGKQDTAADEFGVEGSIEGSSLAEDAFDEVGSTDGDDVIKVTTKLGNADLIVSHDIEEGDSDESETSLFVGTEVSGLGLGFGYQTASDNSTAESKDTIGVQGAYRFATADVFADYSVTEETGNADFKVTNLGASFGAGKNKYTLGLVKQEQGSADAQGWYANVVHKLGKKVSLHAEIADTDEAGTDIGYLAGMRVKF